MKYLVFSFAMLCLPVGVFLLLLERRLLRWTLFFGVLVSVAFFDATAVNFFSNEAYRGTSRGMEVSLVYLMALVLLIAFVVLRGQLYLAPDGGSRLYSLYLLLCLPSFFQAESRLFGWFEMWKMLMMLVVFLAVYGYLVYSRGDFSVVLNAAAVLAIVHLLVIFGQHFHGDYQVRGLFPHRNSMAMFMTLPATLFLARYFNPAPGGRGGRLALLVFAVAAFSVFRSLSRGSAVCFTIGALFTVLCSVCVNFTPRKAGLLWVVAVVAAAGMLYMLPKLYQRFESASEASWAARVRLGKAAINMIRDEPLSGVGLNNWGIKINPPYQYSQFRDERPGATEDWKDGLVETIYLLVAAECGIPCLVVLLAWFGYYLVVCVLLLWRLRHSQLYFIPAGLLGGLLAVFAQSFLEWVLKQQMNFIWLMVFFAVLSYLNRHWRELLAQERATDQSVPGEASKSVAEASAMPEAEDSVKPLAEASAMSKVEASLTPVADEPAKTGEPYV